MARERFGNFAKLGRFRCLTRVQKEKNWSDKMFCIFLVAKCNIDRFETRNKNKAQRKVRPGFDPCQHA